uniref:BTB domain-containing protein n=1 Tax=Haptolina ericina TaxID=156174 RepID=A0A7S3AJH0_9EUKA
MGSAFGRHHPPCLAGAPRLATMGGRKRTRASVAAPSTGDQPDIVTLTSKEGEADALRSNLAVLWREGTLCDVTLIASARHFPAHRLVLAAASPYMKALLAGEHFAESTAKEFELPELSASAFECVLEFIYTRQCVLPSESLQEVLQAACRLQVEGLQTAAESAVIDRISPSVCLDIWELADRLSLAPLIAGAKKVALQSFSEVVATGTYVELPASRLDELLADDRLNVETEQIAFAALERWVAAQAPPASSQVVGGLLSRVRFALIDSNEFRRKLEASPMVQAHPMVLVSAYREERNGEATPRTRRRKSMLPKTFSSFEEVKVWFAAGKRVRVMSDEGFVSEECKASDSLGWCTEMSNLLNTVWKIDGIDDTDESVELDGWGLPYTTLWQEDEDEAVQSC